MPAAASAFASRLSSPSLFPRLLLSFHSSSPQIVTHMQGVTDQSLWPQQQSSRLLAVRMQVSGCHSSACARESLGARRLKVKVGGKRRQATASFCLFFSHASLASTAARLLLSLLKCAVESSARLE